MNTFNCFKSQNGNYITEFTTEKGTKSHYWAGPRGAFIRPATRFEWEFAQSWGTPMEQKTFSFDIRKSGIISAPSVDCVRGTGDESEFKVVWCYNHSKWLCYEDADTLRVCFAKMTPKQIKALRQMIADGKICSHQYQNSLGVATWTGLGATPEMSAALGGCGIFGSFEPTEETIEHPVPAVKFDTILDLMRLIENPNTPKDARDAAQVVVDLFMKDGSKSTDKPQAMAIHSPSGLVDMG